MIQNLVTFFILLQCVLLFFMVFHDWIHVSPLTDIRELEKAFPKRDRFIGSVIFAFIVLIPLVLTVSCREHFPLWALIIMVVDYGILTLGTILSWWVPYFRGSSAEHKKDFAVYRNTHAFLPARGDNVIPNTFHVILHMQIWVCFGIALYLLLKHLGI